MNKLNLLFVMAIVSLSFAVNAASLTVTQPEASDTKGVLITAKTSADEPLVPGLVQWLESNLSINLTADGASRGGKFKYTANRAITVEEQKSLSLPETYRGLGLEFPVDIEEYEPRPKEGDARSEK